MMTERTWVPMANPPPLPLFLKTPPMVNSTGKGSEGRSGGMWLKESRGGWTRGDERLLVSPSLRLRSGLGARIEYTRQTSIKERDVELKTSIGVVCHTEHCTHQRGPPREAKSVVAENRSSGPPSERE